MTNQAKSNNLNCLTDPILQKFNRLFVLSYEKKDESISYSDYYLQNINIGDYKVLIDGKTFFEISIKNKEKNMKKLSESVKIMII